MKHSTLAPIFFLFEQSEKLLNGEKLSHYISCERRNSWIRLTE